MTLDEAIIIILANIFMTCMCVYVERKCNMTRLIDADALKAEVNKKNVIGRFNTLLLIDNAPTVELTELCKGCQYLKDCETCDKNERPHGEWLIEHNTNECNLCGCWFCYEELNDGEANYCPNCGAQMLKGGQV